MTTDRDQLLVKKIKRGDDRALEELIDRFGPWIKGILYKRLKNRTEDQEECLNDTLLKVWENIDQYDPKRGSFKSWVGAVTAYQAIDYLRKAAKLEVVSMGEQEFPQESLSPEHLLIQEDLNRQIQDLLGCLKPEDQEIFIGLFYEDKSYEEVAKTLGLSKPLIYNRVSRARQKLRKVQEERNDG